MKNDDIVLEKFCSMLRDILAGLEDGSVAMEVYGVTQNMFFPDYKIVSEGLAYAVRRKTPPGSAPRETTVIRLDTLPQGALSSPDDLCAMTKFTWAKPPLEGGPPG